MGTYEDLVGRDRESDRQELMDRSHDELIELLLRGEMMLAAERKLLKQVMGENYRPAMVAESI